MKKICVIWQLFFVCAVIVRGGELGNMDTENIVRSFFKNEGASRISGKGVYIHTLYRKAVSLEQAIKGIEFKDEKHKQITIAAIKATSGLDFSLTDDKHAYMVERCYYDNDRVRKEISEIDADKVTMLKNGHMAIDGLKYKIVAFDGNKTISIFEDPAAKPTVISSTAKMPVPDFRRFGLNDSGKDAEPFLQAMATGLLKFESFCDDESINITLKLASVMRFELSLDLSKNMVRSSKLYMGNKLVSETIASNYVKSDSGEWYPQQYTTNKYATIDGQNMLTYSEEYTAIPGTVDFNIPIEPAFFSPNIPDGLLLDNTSGNPILWDVQEGIQRKHNSTADKK